MACLRIPSRWRATGMQGRDGDRIADHAEPAFVSAAADAVIPASHAPASSHSRPLDPPPSATATAPHSSDGSSPNTSTNSTPSPAAATSAP